MARVCVPVCVNHIDQMREAIGRAAGLADEIEFRLDCLSASERNWKSVNELLRATDRQLILTLRSAEQGGHNAIDRDQRRKFWLSLANIPTDTLCDLETDLVLDLLATAENQELSFAWDHVICSHHEFAKAPANLERVYEQMAATPANILKIAIHADDATDCIPIFHLLDHARRDGRNTIGIAMGEPGVMTRVLGPARGSFLTYGALDEKSATASGQITARELREVYRVDRIDERTEIFGIVGNPVSHSLSPIVHNAAFSLSDLNAVYIPFEVHDVGQFMRRMVHPNSRELDWNLRGLSVTAPHKSTVMPYLDLVDPIAKEIGAVNTIAINDKRLLGYNTDADGFIAPLRQAFGSLENVRCAIIGAGGAARACAWTLRREKARVTLFARKTRKGKPLADKLAIGIAQLADADFRNFDVVINATPVGTRTNDQEKSVATADDLRGVRLVYDLVYNPTETKLIREARAAGCETISGIEMFIAQASAQFELWTGKSPDLESMRTTAMQALK